LLTIEPHAVRIAEAERPDLRQRLGIADERIVGGHAIRARAVDVEAQDLPARRVHLLRVLLGIAVVTVTGRGVEHAVVAEEQRAAMMRGLIAREREDALERRRVERLAAVGTVHAIDAVLEERVRRRAGRGVREEDLAVLREARMKR